MHLILLESQFVCNSKKGALAGLSIANPKFSEIAISFGYLHKVGSPGFSLQEIDNLPPITYYWKVPLIFDHSYLVGKLKSSKIADTKMLGFWRC
jgi:hypothetical protein